MMKLSVGKLRDGITLYTLAHSILPKRKDSRLVKPTSRANRFFVLIANFVSTERVEVQIRKLSLSSEQKLGLTRGI
jgi:hypothetical protein